MIGIAPQAVASTGLGVQYVPGKQKTKSVFPLVAKDFGKMMVGLGASVALVLAIHYVILPNGL